MQKIYNRIFILILALFAFQGITLAINSEYKNSLEKIELQKTGDYSYDVNLYMQKSYTSPLKVIKKSDLSYYILLPETKNVSNSLTYADKNSEIQNVKTNLFPYAGIDVNNGYTKIDINTTRPINFNLNIKSPVKYNSSSATVPNATVKKAEAPVKKEENKIQKNSVASQPETKQVKENKVKENKTKEEVKTVKLAKKIEKTTKKETEKISNELKTAIGKAKKTNEIALRRTKNTQKPKKENSSYKNRIQGIEEKNQSLEQKENIEQQAHVKPVEKVIEEKEESPSSKNYFDNDKELIAQDDYFADGEFATAAKILEPETFKEKAIYIFNSIREKLAGYGLGLYDVLLIFFAGLIGFIVLLFLMSNRQNAKKSRRKADLLNINDKPSLTPKKDDSEKDKNNGQYFVFNEDIKQTGFIDPATSAIKKNYELSTYDPDINSNYSYNPISNNTSNESEYDIIQKILKEDTYIEMPPEYTTVKEETKVEDKIFAEEKAITNNAVTSPIAGTDSEIIKEEEENSVTEEPVILAQEEIAPKRGLMLVSYNNNVNLMGYIFDDVFALYNFKTSKLSNNNIQCRLSEKDDKSSLYIVKVADEKMIIRVNNREMKLEITL